MTTSKTNISTSVDRLLELISQGRGSEAAALYAPHALLDATVPEWRFQKRGGQSIAEVWSRWFDEPGRFDELDRMRLPDGEVIRYVEASQSNGTTFTVHHCHVLTLDETTGLIARHHVWCGGRWYPPRRAEMAEAQRAEDEKRRRDAP